MKIIKSEKVKSIEDICGEIKEIYSSEKLSVSLAIITGTAGEHKHLIMEEVYHVISGKGVMHVGNDSQKIAPGDTISIPKNVFHYAEKTSDEPLKVLVVTHPKFDTSDIIRK